MIIYWLGSAGDLSVLRANFIGYFTLLTGGLFGTYLWRGIITSEAIALALFTGPVQVAATWAGASCFITSARTYRCVATSSLPWWRW